MLLRLCGLLLLDGESVEGGNIDRHGPLLLDD